MVDYCLGLIVRIAGHANTGTGSRCEVQRQDSGLRLSGLAWKLSKWELETWDGNEVKLLREEEN